MALNSSVSERKAQRKDSAQREAGEVRRNNPDVSHLLTLDLQVLPTITSQPKPESKGGGKRQFGGDSRCAAGRGGNRSK